MSKGVLLCSIVVLLLVAIGVSSAATTYDFPITVSGGTISVTTTASGSIPWATFKESSYLVNAGWLDANGLTSPPLESTYMAASVGSIDGPGCWYIYPGPKPIWARVTLGPVVPLEGGRCKSDRALIRASVKLLTHIEADLPVKDTWVYVPVLGFKDPPMASDDDLGE